MLATIFLLAQLFSGWNQPLAGTLPATGYATPYNPNPYAIPICTADPCTPNADPQSAAMVASVYTQVGGFAMGQIQQRQPGTAGTSGIAGSWPVFWSSTNDPVYSFSCDGVGQLCPSSLQMPPFTRGAGTTDHHAVIIEPNNVECLFEQFNDGGSGTGTFNPLWGQTAVSAKGGGCTSSLTMYANGGVCTTCRGMATHMPIQPGLLDPQEIINGSINHAIAVAVYCPSSAFYWPAAASDGPCPTGPAEGERLWLNLTDAQINALGRCSWEATLLHQMHHYGLIITDTSGGPQPWNYYSYDDMTQMVWGGAGNWTAFFNWLTTSCPSAAPNFSSGASHLQLTTTGLSANNIVVVI